MKTAVAAVVISLISLIATIVLGAKSYRKSKRLEFLQRRDRLSQVISNLNDRNTEFQLLLARYDIVWVKSAGLPVRGEQAERNAAQTVAIKKQRDDMEAGMKNWDEHIERMHVLYDRFTSESDADAVEELISIAQVASDNLKKTNDGYNAVLHIHETTNTFIKTALDEQDEKLKQIDLDFERKVKNLRLTLPPA
jgi:hypothetical protein